MTSPVVAVVPNYNMAKSLEELLLQLLAQPYAAIYVLDDASTDNSREVVKKHGGRINLIAGQQNKGAGANRNRIIGQVSDDTILHFIDADMRLPANYRLTLPSKIIDPTTAFVGGLVVDKNGGQIVYNFGPRLSLRNDIGSAIHMAIYFLGSILPTVEQLLRRQLKFLRAWTNPRGKLEPQEVFWTSEANMFIRAGVFTSLAGYDPELRDHEILDFSIRSHQQGLKSYFDPSCEAIHTAVNVRSGFRGWSRFKAEIAIVRKHGLIKWLVTY